MARLVIAVGFRDSSTTGWRIPPYCTHSICLAAGSHSMRGRLSTRSTRWFSGRLSLPVMSKEKGKSPSICSPRFSPFNQALVWYMTRPNLSRWCLPGGSRNPEYHVVPADAFKPRNDSSNVSQARGTSTCRHAVWSCTGSNHR